MATSSNIQFPRCIMAFKLEQQFSSQLIKGNLKVKQLGADYLIPNQIMRIKGHCNLLGLTNPHCKFGRTFLKILHSAHLDPRRNCETPQPLQYRLRSLQQKDRETIKNRGEIKGTRQGRMDKSQNIALPTWRSYPQHVAATEQSTTALSPIAVASVQTKNDKHDRMAMLSGVNHC